jgi:hypothetical protein
MQHHWNFGVLPKIFGGDVRVSAVVAFAGEQNETTDVVLREIRGELQNQFPGPYAGVLHQ